MAPSSMWRGCCLLQLDSMGLRQPWCHDNFKTKKLWACFCNLHVFVQMFVHAPAILAFLEKIRAWAIWDDTTPHTSHNEELDLWTKFCWITRRFDGLFNRFQWISIKGFVMSWSCCIFSGTVSWIFCLQSSRQVRQGDCYWMPCLCSRKLEKQSIR